MSRLGNRLDQGPLSLIIGIAVVLLIIFLVTGPDEQPQVRIDDAQAVRMGDGLAVFLRVTPLDEPDRLITVSSGEAATTVLVTRGAGIDPAGLAIPMESGAELSGDGVHAMLTGVSGEIADDRLIDVSLLFEKAGAVSTKAPIARDGPMSHGAMMHRVGVDEPQPTLTLDVEPLEGGAYRILLDAQDFTFAPEAMDGPHAPGEGHAHLYLNGVKLARVVRSEYQLGALPSGRHTLRATLNTNDHRTYVVDGAAVEAVLELVAP